MYSVSSKYKNGIYGTSRMNKGRVTFDISDTTAVGDVQSISVTSESTLSLKSQLTDKVRTSAYKFATQEQNRMTLDGTWTFADQTLANNGEIGWASDAICDVNGVFATPQQITVAFNGDHSSIGLTITFDPMNNEYATDFSIIAYDANNNVLANLSYTGNTLAQVAAYTQGETVNYRKVVVQINKWSVPNRRARVAEIDFGVVQVYTGETGLVSLQLTEEMDLTTSSVASPEFKFTVDNSSKNFNILNPTGFYKSLQQRQQVIGEVGLVGSDGVSIEWVPIGNYLLWEWQSDEGSLTATFFSRTQLDVMATFSYENLTSTSISLYQLAVNIFNLCGITNYSIDTALQNITTNGLIKNTNCKDILQMIAIAGQANIFVTRNNVITLKVLSAPTTPVDTVSLNDQYQEPRINLDKIIKQVNVSYYTDLNTQTIVSVTASGVTDGDTLQLDGNTLINTSAQATSVANWVLAQKNNNRAIYTLNWRGNQAQELGDVIAISNSFTNATNAYITRTELKYEGYVQATTELRGASN